ncbi:hypothetical protein IMZ48_26255 [Candidatus Bathyarchaeota archaeon]|nr:hypothetical protein [Candidatus Bathyarchaeota archaeon]
MMTLEQAKEILDTVVRQTRMTRDEHSLAAQAIELLYSGAQENAETAQKIIPIRTPDMTVKD